MVERANAAFPTSTGLDASPRPHATPRTPLTAPTPKPPGHEGATRLAGCPEWWQPTPESAQSPGVSEIVCVDVSWRVSECDSVKCLKSWGLHCVRRGERHSPRLWHARCFQVNRREPETARLAGRGERLSVNRAVFFSAPRSLLTQHPPAPNRTLAVPPSLQCPGPIPGVFARLVPALVFKTCGGREQRPRSVRFRSTPARLKSLF